MPLGRTKSSHKLGENVYAYHLVNCDFQLLRRFGLESKVWKTHCDARESDRLECRWQKIIWRAWLSVNCHTCRDFQETYNRILQFSVYWPDETKRQSQSPAFASCRLINLERGYRSL